MFKMNSEFIHVYEDKCLIIPHGRFYLTDDRKIIWITNEDIICISKNGLLPCDRKRIKIYPSLLKLLIFCIYVTIFYFILKNGIR